MSQTEATYGANLRRQSSELASGFPDLLASAQRLASNFQLGVHGRKRAGSGEEFWQYRSASFGDQQKDIDWRRSARSDALFVRQQEWQMAQSVHFWVDQGASMKFASGKDGITKLERAQVLTLALAILLSRSGERFAALEDETSAKTGETQLSRLAHFMLSDGSETDYASVPMKVVPSGSRAVFVSDFLGDFDGFIEAVSRIADQDVHGLLVQVLDPQEISFPFKGRTLFQSMKGSLSFESRRADALRKSYLSRLEERKEQLSNLAKRTGWQVLNHDTQAPAQNALLWMYNQLDMSAGQ